MSRLLASIRFQGMGERVDNAQKGGGVGNTAGGVRARCRHGQHDCCPAGTESRRIVPARGKVAGRMGDGNGERRFNVGREVASRILRLSASADK